MTLQNNEYFVLDQRVPKGMPLADINNHCVITGAWLVTKRIGGKDYNYFRYMDLETTNEYEGYNEWTIPFCINRWF